MDPLTQGALGAALPQSTWAAWTRHSKYQVAIAGALGLAGGMAADLDVFIRSDTDPLLFLTYHRQFTHSLLFMPVGGFIVASVLHVCLGNRWRLRFLQTLLICTLGFLTHALLDSATSYGTMLFWPFSQARISWSIISIVDPLFTVPLAVLTVIAALRGNPWLARLGLFWGLLYLGMGWMQHQSARSMAEDLAALRGHTPIRFEIKPSFGNIVVWKSVYEADGRFYVDAFRAGISPKIFEGSSVAKLAPSRDVVWLDPDSQQATDVQRFIRFSDGFVAIDPGNANRIIDVRYSFVPNEVSALFSIDLTPHAAHDVHVEFRTHRDLVRESMNTLWQMVIVPAQK